MNILLRRKSISFRAGGNEENKKALYIHPRNTLIMLEFLVQTLIKISLHERHKKMAEEGGTY